MDVRIVSPAPAVRFAATELTRCLNQIDPAAELDLTLGLFADLKQSVPGVADAELDDAFSAELSSGRLTIAGTNPRAVLIGAYRVLHELGCRWLFPGVEGEILPTRSLKNASLKLNEKASFRHRTVCIEGATSVTNVLDMIDWLPKVGFNGFYMQFREGYQFFDRWYSHHGDLVRARKEPIERTMAEEFTKLGERAVAERDLLYHTVGHGWHCEAFGVPGIGWMDLHNLPKAFTDKAAVIDGQRPILWAKPMLTSLCFSDPEVQREMAREIADYSDANPQVDYVHVWLDDGGNNMCECQRCRTKIPTDWYIQVLNAVDAELTRRKNNKKIVFLAYNDLLWAPREESFNHPERFVFMYANSRRNYVQALARTTAKAPEHKLNRMPSDAHSPTNVAAFLQEWKSQFSGDSFIYEYYGGAETQQLARVVYDDIQALPLFELNGIVNCQALRVFFPTGVGMQIMGNTLWNSKLPFDDQVNDYFAAAFGKHAAACLKFVRDTEAAATLAKSRNAAGAPADDPEKLKAIEQLRSALKTFAPTLEAGQKGAENAAQRISWRMLEVYAGVLDRLIHYTVGGGSAPAVAFNELRNDLCAVEDELQPWMEMGIILHRFLR